MTEITRERIEKMTRLLITNKNTKPSEVKLSKEAKKLDRLLVAKERTRKVLERV